MPFFVYALCAVTSVICCGLLLRQHRRAPRSLLSHSATAFFCFAVSNVLLFVDRILLPQVDLRLWRNLAALVGVAVLLIALINHRGRNER